MNERNQYDKDTEQDNAPYWPLVVPYHNSDEGECAHCEGMFRFEDMTLVQPIYPRAVDYWLCSKCAEDTHP